MKYLYRFTSDRMINLRNKHIFIEDAKHKIQEELKREGLKLREGRKLREERKIKEDFNTVSLVFIKCSFALAS